MTDDELMAIATKATANVSFKVKKGESIRRKMTLIALRSVFAAGLEEAAKIVDGYPQRIAAWNESEPRASDIGCCRDVAREIRTAAKEGTRR